MDTVYVGDTEIRILPDPDGGQQTIRVQSTPLGELLARTLLQGIASPPLVRLSAHDEVAPDDEGFYLLAHTPEMDARVCALIELFVSMRYNHPQLLQLSLFTGAGLADVCLPPLQEVLP